MTSHTATALRLMTLSACLWLSTAQAQLTPPAADPTRPPEAWLALQPATPDASPQQNPDSGAHIAIIGKKNHRYAMIDGQLVKPGDDINGAKVLAIKANAITLKQNGTHQVLSLTPGVQKISSKPAKRPAPRAPAN